MSTQFQTIAILGRQPALGLAELESLYGADSVMRFGAHALLTRSPAEINHQKLGGTIRTAKIIDEVPNNWRDIEGYLLKHMPQHSMSISGKLTFGLSVYGMKLHKKDVARTALLLKKAIKKSGASVRMVPHDGLELNAATVLYNKLTGPQGWELLVVSDGKKVFVAQTSEIQDIDAYAARDRERPMRDAKVGMLPPKLAQIIINLATSENENRQLVLDPFCGTGVLMQEAMLMDYDIYGTDIDARMVQYTIDNLAWLDSKYPDVGDYRRIEIGDATNHEWQKAKLINAVACETYLGQPLSTLPPSDQLSKIMTEVNSLHHKFLQNIGSQIKSGTRLCLAMPTWRGKREFLHLKVLDYLEDLGYTRVRFTHVRTEDLIYHREGQVVGRELVVLIKK